MKARASIQRNTLHTYPQHSALNFKGWLDPWKPICGCPSVPCCRLAFFISIKRNINFAFSPGTERKFNECKNTLFLKLGREKRSLLPGAIARLYSG